MKHLAVVVFRVPDVHKNRYMKRILFLLPLLFTIHCYGQKSDSSYLSGEKQFIAELSSFIDSVKSQSIGHGKYNVFVADISAFNNKNNNICFTLGYILN